MLHRLHTISNSVGASAFSVAKLNEAYALFQRWQSSALDTGKQLAEAQQHAKTSAFHTPHASCEPLARNAASGSARPPDKLLQRLLLAHKPSRITKLLQYCSASVGMHHIQASLELINKWYTRPDYQKSPGWRQIMNTMALVERRMLCLAADWTVHHVYLYLRTCNLLGYKPQKASLDVCAGILAASTEPLQLGKVATQSANSAPHHILHAPVVDMHAMHESQATASHNILSAAPTPVHAMHKSQATASVHGPKSDPNNACSSAVMHEHMLQHRSLDSDAALWKPAQRTQACTTPSASTQAAAIPIPATACDTPTPDPLQVETLSMNLRPDTKQHGISSLPTEASSPNEPNDVAAVPVTPPSNQALHPSLHIPGVPSPPLDVSDTLTRLAWSISGTHFSAPHRLIPILSNCVPLQVHRSPRFTAGLVEASSWGNMLQTAAHRLPGFAVHHTLSGGQLLSGADTGGVNPAWLLLDHAAKRIDKSVDISVGSTRTEVGLDLSSSQASVNRFLWGDVVSSALGMGPEIASTSHVQIPLKSHACIPSAHEQFPSTPHAQMPFTLQEQIPSTSHEQIPFASHAQVTSTSDPQISPTSHAQIPTTLRAQILPTLNTATPASIPHSSWTVHSQDPKTPIYVTQAAANSIPATLPSLQRIPEPCAETVTDTQGVPSPHAPRTTRSSNTAGPHRITEQPAEPLTASQGVATSHMRRTSSTPGIPATASITQQPAANCTATREPSSYSRPRTSHTFSITDATSSTEQVGESTRVTRDTGSCHLLRTSVTSSIPGPHSVTEQVAELLTASSSRLVNHPDLWTAALNIAYNTSLHLSCKSLVQLLSCIMKADRPGSQHVMAAFCDRLLTKLDGLSAWELSVLLRALTKMTPRYGDVIQVSQQLEVKMKMLQLGDVGLVAEAVCVLGQKFEHNTPGNTSALHMPKAPLHLNDHNHTPVAPDSYPAPPLGSHNPNHNRGAGSNPAPLPETSMDFQFGMTSSSASIADVHSALHGLVCRAVDITGSQVQQVPARTLDSVLTACAQFGIKPHSLIQATIGYLHAQRPTHKTSQHIQIICTLLRFAKHCPETTLPQCTALWTSYGTGSWPVQLDPCILAPNTSPSTSPPQQQPCSTVPATPDHHTVQQEAFTAAPFFTGNFAHETSYEASYETGYGTASIQHATIDIQQEFLSMEALCLNPAGARSAAWFSSECATADSSSGLVASVYDTPLLTQVLQLAVPRLFAFKPAELHYLLQHCSKVLCTVQQSTSPSSSQDIIRLAHSTQPLHGPGHILSNVKRDHLSFHPPPFETPFGIVTCASRHQLPCAGAGGFHDATLVGDDEAQVTGTEGFDRLWDVLGRVFRAVGRPLSQLQGMKPTPDATALQLTDFDAKCTAQEHTLQHAQTSFPPSCSHVSADVRGRQIRPGLATAAEWNAVAQSAAGDRLCSSPHGTASHWQQAYSTTHTIRQPGVSARPDGNHLHQAIMSIDCKVMQPGMAVSTQAQERSDSQPRLSPLPHPVHHIGNAALDTPETTSSRVRHSGHYIGDNHTDARQPRTSGVMAQPPKLRESSAQPVSDAQLVDMLFALATANACNLLHSNDGVDALLQQIHCRLPGMPLKDVALFAAHVVGLGIHDTTQSKSVLPVLAQIAEQQLYSQAEPSPDLTVLLWAMVQLQHVPGSTHAALHTCLQRVSAESLPQGTFLLLCWCHQQAQFSGCMDRFWVGENVQHRCTALSDAPLSAEKSCQIGQSLSPTGYSLTQSSELAGEELAHTDLAGTGREGTQHIAPAVAGSLQLQHMDRVAQTADDGDQHIHEGVAPLPLPGHIAAHLHRLLHDAAWSHKPQQSSDVVSRCAESASMQARSTSNTLHLLYLLDTWMLSRTLQDPDMTAVEHAAIHSLLRSLKQQACSVEHAVRAVTLAAEAGQENTDALDVVGAAVLQQLGGGSHALTH